LKFIPIRSLILCGLVATIVAPALGQTSSPSQQLGIGIATDGGQIQYAVSSNLHVGLAATFLAETGDAGGSSFALTPYVRFLFNGFVHPYVSAGIVVVKRSALDATEFAFGTFGLEYFFNANAGLFAEVPIVRIPFQSGNSTLIGFESGSPNPIAGRMGIEWYFGR